MEYTKPSYLYKLSMVLGETICALGVRLAGY